MTSKKQLPHERGKGEAALSEFAEYVEKQQEMRYPSYKAATSTGPSNSTTAAGANTGAAAQTDDEHHDELDAILDSLDLSDSGPRVRLRDLLLSTDDESLRKLADILTERFVEGSGETVFEIGFENNGESMKLTLEEWEKAYKRLLEAAKQAKADCQLLLTKNVGGEVEGQPTAGKDKDCSGKVMVRQVPATVENVIETRIAVVGNGEFGRASRNAVCL
jgi:hypothetical protein